MKKINQYIKELADHEIFEVIGDGVSIQDTDYKVLYQNKAHKDLVEEHIGEYCYQAYEKRDSICEGCPVEESFRDGKIHKAERTAPTDKGTLYVDITASPLKDSTGRIIAGIEIVRDITERKRIEKEIKGKEHFLNDVFNSIQDGISILDKEMNIIRVNKTMEEWYPYSMPLESKKCYEAYHSQSKSCEICPSKQTLKNGQVAIEEIPKRDSKGNVVGWLELYSYPMMDTESNKIKGIIEYVRDITKRKKMENELRNRINELEDFYNMAIGRELKMKELKEEIKGLKSDLSRYKK